MEESETKRVINYDLYVHKKVMANEIYNLHKRSTYMSVGAIMGVLMIFALLVLHKYAGVIATVIFACIYAAILAKDNARMKYLNNEYKIEPHLIKNE